VYIKLVSLHEYIKMHCQQNIKSGRITHH